MLPSPKAVINIAGTALTAGSTTTAVVDRLGYDYAIVDVAIKGVEATTAPAALKLRESDITDATGYADVSGFVGGTGFTLPTSMASNAATVVRMKVDCRARKRYLQVSYSPGTHSTLVVAANLYRADQTLETAAGQNVTTLVTG